MDTITHGLSGALLGRALSNRIKKLQPKTFILVGTIAAMFPDFDFLFILFGKENYLANHRGITHSIILMPIWAFLISWFFAWLLKNKHLLHKDWVDETATEKEIIKELFFLSFFSILLHVLCDIITSFGTMFLAPVDRTRFEIGSVYIVDLWFTGIIVTGLLASWFVKKDQYLMSRIFLTILVGYVGFTQHIKSEAEQYGLGSLKMVHADPSKLTLYSVPMAFSPYNWSITAYDAEKEVYYTSEFNINAVKIFKDNTWKKTNRWGATESEQTVAKTAWSDPTFGIFPWFIKIPAFNSIIKNEQKVCVYFKDLRFTSPIGDNPFVYGLCVTKDGKKYRSHLIEGVDNPL